MFKKCKAFIAGFISCMIVSLGIVAAAASQDLIKIEAAINTPIKFMLFGKQFTPKDAAGNYIKPIIYKGSNYLPVRTIAEALNIPIEYVGETKTIWIGGVTSKVPVNEVSLFEQKYYNKLVLSVDTEKLTTPDKIYKWGIVNEKQVSMVELGCIIKPSSKYNRFTADLFLDENAGIDQIVEFKDTDEKGLVLKSVTVKPGETVSVDIDISGIDRLFIYTRRTTYDKITKLIIGEPTLHNDPSQQADKN